MTRQAGTLLYSWRTRRQLTQVELGARVNRRAQSISAYEAGDNAPEPDIVRALDDALEAGGELVEAYGLSPMPAAPQMWAAIETLQELVTKAVARLERQHEQLESRIAQLERRRGR